MFRLKKAKEERRESLKIEIGNLTSEQKEALLLFFGAMQRFGGIGHSTLVAVGCDGDGDFHPEIKVNGKEPDFDDSKRNDYERYHKELGSIFIARS